MYWSRRRGHADEVVAHQIGLQFPQGLAAIGLGAGPEMGIAADPQRPQIGPADFRQDVFLGGDIRRQAAELASHWAFVRRREIAQGLLHDVGPQR